MAREADGYRNALEAILSFTGGCMMLNYSQVKDFTGLGDNRTVRRRFPMQKGQIAATELARCLSATPKKRGCI